MRKYAGGRESTCCDVIISQPLLANQQSAAACCRTPCNLPYWSSGSTEHYGTTSDLGCTRDVIDSSSLICETCSLPCTAAGMLRIFTSWINRPPSFVCNIIRTCYIVWSVMITANWRSTALRCIIYDCEYTTDIELSYRWTTVWFGFLSRVSVAV